MTDYVMHFFHHFRLYRHQQSEERPTFPDVVDELLELEKEMPGVSYTDNVKDSMDDCLDGLMGGKK